MELYCLTTKNNLNKSSAVAEMGDRGHNRHGPKREGGVVPLSRGLGPRLVQCGLNRGLLPYQAGSSSIQSFGHNRHEPKSGWSGCALFLGVAGSTSNTMSRRPRPTSIASGILIHLAVWPQQTWAENWGAAPPCRGGGLVLHLT